MGKARVEEWINQMDCLPSEALTQGNIERIAGGIARFYGFERFSPAPLEGVWSFAPLVRAGLMESQPPIACKTRNGEEFMLSPSGALGAVRAYFSHRMQSLPHPVKLFYASRSFFVGKRPEADADGNRVASRSEWGLMELGEESPIAETEIVQVLCKTLAEVGLDGNAMDLRLNAVGCGRCGSLFRSSLSAYFRSRLGRLCPESKRDLRRAPTRILSCPEERCQQAAGSAPQVLDFLCERCKKQLRGLLEFLEEARVPYFLDTRLFAEGLWFTETVFEVRLDRTAAAPAAADAGAAASLAGDKIPVALGGRLSHAAGLLGGKELQVASGVLLLDAVREAIRKKQGEIEEIEVFFVQLGELAKRKSFEILEALREGGIEAKESLGRDSIKVQLKIAERLGARFALILGQKEALDRTVIVREAESGIQETVPQDKLIEFLKKKLKK